MEAAGGGGQIDRHGNRRSRAQRRRRSFLAEIFEQHAAAQRIAGRRHAVPAEAGGKLGQHGPEIAGPPGVILLMAQAKRRAGAAQVEAHDRKSGPEQRPRARPDMDAVLAAGEAVDQDDQRPQRRFRRDRGPAGQDIAGTVRHLEMQGFFRPWRQVDSLPDKHIAQGLQIAAPPRRPGPEFGDGVPG